MHAHNLDLVKLLKYMVKLFFFTSDPMLNLSPHANYLIYFSLLTICKILDFSLLTIRPKIFSLSKAKDKFRPVEQKEKLRPLTENFLKRKILDLAGELSSEQ